MNGNGGFGFKGVGAGAGPAGQRPDPRHTTWEEGLPEDQPLETTLDDQLSDDRVAGARLPLGEDNRLPWLESPDDVDFDDDSIDSGRLIGFVLMAIAALGLVVGTVWWVARTGDAAGDADGSMIAASKQPYKVRPQDAGGKVFEGTGDLTFEVSEGIGPQGSVAPGPAPAPAPVSGAVSGPVPVQTSAQASASAPVAGLSPSAGSSASPAQGDNADALAAMPGGTGVQIGAFSTRTAAEAAWTRYQGQHETLQGVGHRIVEGRADIGTVYRLQAIAGSAAAARSLCASLQARGLKCQVK